MGFQEVWFEGSLRSDGSVTAHLWAQEKLARVDGTGGRDGTDEGSIRGPRGPKKKDVDIWTICEAINTSVTPSKFYIDILTGGVVRWQGKNGVVDI